MSDAPNSFDPNGVPPAAPMPAAANPSGGFFATVAGKATAIGAVVIVAVIAAAAVYFFVISPSSSSAPPSGGAAVTPASGGSLVSSVSADPTQQEPIVDPPEKPLESTFTFRNVFAPTLKMQMPLPVVTPSATTTSSSTTSSTPSVPADTLFLQSIQTVNGRTTATFIWNGATYVLAKGDAIPNTPWELISIGETSVVMQFGDVQVTLTTGEGLSK
jgi:type IV pilus biogenesis protein PilP